jgi:exopolysaccharide production protein ExoY
MPDTVKSVSLLYADRDTLISAQPLGGWVKRSFDVVGSLAGLVVLSPLFLLIMLLVKRMDPGPVFYGHARIGRGGQVFYCLKFRTMVENSDAVLRRYLASRPEARAEWTATRKLRNDPRVTLVGEVLRKLSLDELPQLINVLRGEMSLVGPRPVVFEELEMYGNSVPHYLRTRPGLTGPWQVSGRSDVAYERRVALDRWYAENWTLWRDITIILRTIPAVLSARGSY